MLIGITQLTIKSIKSGIGTEVDSYKSDLEDEATNYTIKQYTEAYINLLKLVRSRQSTIISKSLDIVRGYSSISDTIEDSKNYKQQSEYKSTNLTTNY